MINITDEQLESVRNQLADAEPQAVGYRLMVRPLPATKGMESAEANQFSELSKAGFQVKSNDAQSRETHGSDIGVVAHVGPDSYSVGMLKDCDPWVKEGDVVIFKRYAGYCCELPPGSGQMFHFMSDDDIEGKYKGVEL